MNAAVAGGVWGDKKIITEEMNRKGNKQLRQVAAQHQVVDGAAGSQHVIYVLFYVIVQQIVLYAACRLKVTGENAKRRDVLIKLG